MDVKKVISFDKGVVWKSDHTSNPYAIVLKAKKIWKFTKTENPKSYDFFVKLIDENATIFKWGLQKQKSFKIFNHNQYCYFYTQDEIVYRVVFQEEKEKKKTKKIKKTSKDKLVY